MNHDPLSQTLFELHLAHQILNVKNIMQKASGNIYLGHLVG